MLTLAAGLLAACMPGNRKNEKGGASGDSTSDSQNLSSRCLGQTQQGERCKHMTANENGFCDQHAEQYTTDAAALRDSVADGKRLIAVRCDATLESGARCKRMTRSPNSMCYQHGGN